MNRFSNLNSHEQNIVKEKVVLWFNEGKGYKKISKLLAEENVSIIK